MPRISLLLTLGLLPCAWACSEPNCPHPYKAYGDQCRLCPPGEVRERGVCVPALEGGVEEVAAEDGGIEPDSQDAVEPDADHDGGHADPNNEPVPDTEPHADAGGASGEESRICYRDLDGDGVGAGEPIPCDADDPSTLVTTGMDCDDDDAKRSPSLSDVCGDGIDNDCDDAPDDESNNACGGPCNDQLGHQPGEPCSNGLKGACSVDGKYECRGTMAVVCNAPTVAASSERCGDNIDNDCDGEADEPDAVDAKVWYQDCDGDGYAPSAADAWKACKKPADRNGCGWTERTPVQGTTQDCDDTSKFYHPGADFGLPPTGKTSSDLNCDGIDERERGVATPNPFGAALGHVVYPLCDASLSCAECAASVSSGQGAQWLVSGQPTNNQPPCSKTDQQTLEWRMTLRASAVQACEGDTWPVSGVGDALQRCR